MADDNISVKRKLEVRGRWTLDTDEANVLDNVSDAMNILVAHSSAERMREAVNCLISEVVTI